MMDHDLVLKPMVTWGSVIFRNLQIFPLNNNLILATFNIPQPRMARFEARALRWLCAGAVALALTEAVVLWSTGKKEIILGYITMNNMYCIYIETCDGYWYVM